MNILVTGSAGYIGGVFCEMISETTDHKIIGVDKRYSSNEKGRFVKISGDYSNCNLNKTLLKHKVDAVVHFAGRIEVGKSASESGDFFLENVGKPTTLFGEIALYQKLAHKQIPVICSSSAAVYGSHKDTAYVESDNRNPVSVYGKTKSIFEDIAENYSSTQQHYLSRVSSLHFRYFNAAGAYKNKHGIFGENHLDCTHLIPNMLKMDSKLLVFGHDYNTIDGTAERDYVHVVDIARAHLLGIEYLDKKIKENRSHFEVMNLGSGTGKTVLEIAECAKRLGLLHNDHQIEFFERRKGDPDSLVANTHLANTKLGWTSQNSIEEILLSSSEYHKGKQ